jgi:hypothetical protein
MLQAKWAAAPGYIAYFATKFVAFLEDSKALQTAILLGEGAVIGE